MTTGNEQKNSNSGILFVAAILLPLAFYYVYASSKGITYYANEKVATTTVEEVEEVAEIKAPEIDKADYDKRLIALANYPQTIIATTSSSTPIVASSSTEPARNWPVKDVYPLHGAILPFKRIVAYYGNFYSKHMGALGEYDEVTLKSMLRKEMLRYEATDPTTPVIPAVHYIASVAQSEPGRSGKYILRMPDEHIERAIALGRSMEGITFLDIQQALSDLLTEVKAIENYLKEPDVHLGIDPEFAMKNGKRPGSVVGTLDATEVNEIIDLLVKTVQENNLPPKVLIIHRFTEGMLTNVDKIKLTPEVQVVINADGWGSPTLKKAIYGHVIYDEPVQFSGIKLFYKNDLKKPSTRLLTPEEIMQLQPRPIYIQYQ